MFGRAGDRTGGVASCLLLLVVLAAAAARVDAQVAALGLERLVDPSSVLRKQGDVIRFGLDFFIEFESLEEMFGYVDEQAGRWEFASASERRVFADGLARRGVESRVISMAWEDPREVLVTHTREQLAAAVVSVRTEDAPLIYRGRHWSLEASKYRAMWVEVQEKWKASLNCWSAAPSVAERVLSNWYIVREGITLFGASYDSTEHFWQAVKFHPEVHLEDLSEVLERVRAVDWEPWLEALATDQQAYLAHSYALEFLKQNLTQRLGFFADRIEEYETTFAGPVRALQQRSNETPWHLRFTALEEKIFWGDLADVFHLIYHFVHWDGGRFHRPELAPVLDALEHHHFDAIYIPGYLDGKVDFISPEFRRLMFEIWKVKFLETERFREVIRSTEGSRLLHFLNDGDSPDIPIPIYVGFLEEIRELALQ